MVRFKYPANGDRPPVDLCWYDGGMRPATPVELMNDNKGLPEEGMMFIGDKGKNTCRVLMCRILKSYLVKNGETKCKG